MKLIGHLNRHNYFLNNIFEWRIMARRPRGSSVIELIISMT